MGRLLHLPPELVGVAGAALLRLWLGTLRRRVWLSSTELDPNHPGHSGGYIYAFWHESILGVLGVGRARHSSAALISRHRDGEYIARVAQRFGYRVVRGSSSRGAAAAVLSLLRQAERTNLLVTPDGPRGPRRQVQPGLVYLAARSGKPVVPVGVGYAAAWRVRSWDRFALPKPGSLVTAVAGPAIYVPVEAAEQTDWREWWRSQIERLMLSNTAQAERAARFGEPPELELTPIGRPDRCRHAA